LKGYIDLVDAKDVIIDHKTTKRSMSQEDVGSDLQLSCYALAYRSLLGGHEKELRFDILVRTKTPKIQQIVTTRTQDDIDRFLKMVAYVSKAIKSGIFYPNKNFMCSVCGYSGLCSKW
jgi:putative RecB family exonuclease